MVEPAMTGSGNLTKLQAGNRVETIGFLQRRPN